MNIHGCLGESIKTERDQKYVKKNKLCFSRRVVDLSTSENKLRSLFNMSNFFYFQYKQSFFKVNLR